MVNDTTYNMAIDLLCCHLGLSEDEARDQLGLESDQAIQKRISETQEALMGLQD